MNGRADDQSSRGTESRGADEHRNKGCNKQRKRGGESTAELRTIRTEKQRKRGVGKQRSTGT